MMDMSLQILAPNEGCALLEEELPDDSKDSDMTLQAKDNMPIAETVD